MSKWIITFLMASLSLVTARASDEVQAMGPCKADIAKLCGNIEAGKGRIRDCLKSNEASLSTECKEKIAQKKTEMKEKRQDLQEACKTEAENFCKDVPKGQGGIIRCLQEKKNETGFGEACKTALGNIAGHLSRRHY